MKKHNKAIDLWNRVITSDMLPLAWGTAIIMIISTVLLTLALLSFKWLLATLGVM
jgi:hypothetical protein